MNKIPNKQVICNVLIEEANNDRDIVVLCSDSRGSGSITDYVKAHPKQFVEVGIAEQNLVSISAGLARCGKKAFAVSPACFLSTRSMEQIKVDVAYSNTNVKLIGISGGVSYGALGLTHHSSNDIAILSSVPNLNVYLPSDRFQTEALMRELVKNDEPAYIRVGRNAVEDVYEEGQVPFELNKATTLCEGNDVTIIACGELVRAAKLASEALREQGVAARVLDMYCVKPMDEDAVVRAMTETKAILVVEEHTTIGGLGARVSQVVAAKGGVPVKCLGLPDAPVVTGNSAQVFAHYGLTEEGIVEQALELIKHV